MLGFKNKWAQDTIIATAQFRVSWWDCIKMFFGWETSVRVEIETEVPPGKTSGEWDAKSVPPEWWPKPRQQGAKDRLNEEAWAGIDHEIHRQKFVEELLGK